MNDSVDEHSRRRFLINSTSALTAAAIATTAIPFLGSWRPTAATVLAGLPASVDLTKISDGEGVKLLWRGSPMWVVRRSATMIKQLESVRSRLKDPDSANSEQPPYAANNLRSRRADIMVFTAICTHLGCIPELKGSGDADLGADFSGGFVCPCHGSRFDTAGRVLKGSPASDNLAVPPYYFENDDTLVIGADGPQAKI